jgi:hypothetical protein
LALYNIDLEGYIIVFSLILIDFNLIINEWIVFILLQSNMLDKSV